MTPSSSNTICFGWKFEIRGYKVIFLLQVILPIISIITDLITLRIVLEGHSAYKTETVPPKVVWLAGLPDMPVNPVHSVLNLTFLFGGTGSNFTFLQLVMEVISRDAIFAGNLTEVHRSCSEIAFTLGRRELCT